MNWMDQQKTESVYVRQKQQAEEAARWMKKKSKTCWLLPDYVLNKESKNGEYEIGDPARYIMSGEPVGKSTSASRVYKGWDDKMGRWVAAKVLPRDWIGGDSEKWLRAMEAEAKTMAKVTVSGVVEVYDYSMVDGLPAIVMEWLDPSEWLTVADVLGKGGAMSPLEVLVVVDSLADTMKELANVGIRHRDIKPANIFVTEDGRVKLGDFGSSNRVIMAVGDDGLIVGTIGYMPLETFWGIRQEGERSDQFGLAATVYEMLTEKRCFLASTLDVMQVAVREGDHGDIGKDYGLIEKVGTETVGRVREVINRALSANPEQRYPTTAEFAVELRKAFGM